MMTVLSYQDRQPRNEQNARSLLGMYFLGFSLIQVIAVGTVSMLGRPGLDTGSQRLLFHIILVLFQLACFGLLPALFACSLTIWIRLRRAGIRYGTPLATVSGGAIAGLLSMFLAAVFPAGLWGLSVLGTMSCSALIACRLSRSDADADPISLQVVRRFRTRATWSGSLCVGFIVLGLMSAAASARTCERHTARWIAADEMRGRPFKMSPAHPNSDADRIFAEIGAATQPAGAGLIPGDLFPWADVSSAKVQSPFLVMVNFNGSIGSLAGRGGYKTYFCLFGLVWEVNEVTEWIS